MLGWIRPGDDGGGSRGCGRRENRDGILDGGFPTTRFAAGSAADPSESPGLTTRGDAESITMSSTFTHACACNGSASALAFASRARRWPHYALAGLSFRETAALYGLLHVIDTPAELELSMVVVPSFTVFTCARNSRMPLWRELPTLCAVKQPPSTTFGQIATK